MNGNCAGVKLRLSIKTCKVESRSQLFVLFANWRTSLVVICYDARSHFDVKIEKVSRGVLNFNTRVTISQVYGRNIGILEINLHGLNAGELGCTLICGHSIELAKINGHPIKGPLIFRGITCVYWTSLSYRGLRAILKSLFDQILICLCRFILFLDLITKNKCQIATEVISSTS